MESICDTILSREEVQNMMQVEPIDRIRNRFKNEWLLIRVVDFDRKRTLALTGRLIAHSKVKEELYPIERKYRKSLTYITHTGERPPYAILF